MLLVRVTISFAHCRKAQQLRCFNPAMAGDNPIIGIRRRFTVLETDQIYAMSGCYTRFPSAQPHQGRTTHNTRDSLT
jgi:hypothetical protein